jgi:hypothetical protein
VKWHGDHTLHERAIRLYDSGFGGLEVACWPLVPKFAVGGEVKPSVPCRRFTACKKIPKCNVKAGI